MKTVKIIKEDIPVKRGPLLVSIKTLLNLHIKTGNLL